MWRLFGKRLLPRAAVVAPVVLLQPPTACGKTKHETVQGVKDEAARAAQMREAMAWAESNDKKAWATANRKDEHGNLVWPLISVSALDQRMKGKVDNDNPYAAHQVLTAAEESDLVATCKELNSHGQGLDREHLGNLVLDCLKLRHVLNVGRDYKPLSHNAKKMLASGEVGQEWFTGFFSRNPTLSEKRPCAEEILRARWMTPTVSASHFEALRALLKRVDLLDDLGRITDPRRLLNSDECPNPWRGTGDRGKVIAEVGQPCKKLVSAARQHTSLDVMIGLDGHLYAPHIIFAGVYIQRQMIPRKEAIPYAKISATEKGYQTGASLLEGLKCWDRELVRRGVPKPVVWTTDGHASRLNSDVLRWCRENEWIMYLYPPHTTGIHQWLDQIFNMWHKTFNGCVKAWCDANPGGEIDKSKFTDLFSEAWPKWTKPAAIVAAAGRCGVSVSGLNPAAIPRSKLVLSESVSTTKSPAVPLPAPTPLPLLPSPAGSGDASTSSAPLARPTFTSEQLASLDQDWVVPEPKEGECGTRAEFYKAKCDLLEEEARRFRAMAIELRNTPITLKETHPSWQVKYVTPPTEEERKEGQRRIKGQWGDMDSVQMLEQLDAQQKEEEKERDAKEERKRDMAERRAERELLAQQKKELKEAQRALEAPATHLLQRLRFTEENQDEISGAQLADFVKANRAKLKELGVDISATSRVKLMPELLGKIATAPGNFAWVAAPPKVLLPPKDGEPPVAPALLLPPPAPPEQASSAPSSPRETAAAPDEAPGSIEKPAPKRNRGRRGSAE